MFKLVSLICYLMFAMLLVGCGIFTNTDELIDPMELTKFKNEISPRTAWKVNAGKGVADDFSRLAPMHIDEQLITLDRIGNLNAWSKSSGSRLWSQETNLNVKTGANGGDGTVLVGGTGGNVQAYSTEAGELLWSKALNSGVTAISTAKDAQVVVRTENGYIHALELASGEIRWSINREVPALSLHSQSTPLFYGDKVLVGLDNGRLLALSAADGKVVWERAVASGRGRNELDRMVDIDGRFEVENDIAYVVTYQGSLAAINIDSGEVIWTQDASSVAGLSIDADRIYYADSDDTVRAIDKFLGEPIWENAELLRRDLTVPIAHGDYVVAVDYEGYLHWFDKADGRLIARQKTGAGVITAPYVSDDLLYVLDTKGSLSVWRLPNL